MVLLLQISADDIAVAHKNSSLVSSQNVISASFGASEKAREGVSKSLTCFSSGLLPGSGIHTIMSKTGQAQAGGAKSSLRGRDPPGERSCFDLERDRKQNYRKPSFFFLYVK